MAVSLKTLQAKVNEVHKAKQAEEQAKQAAIEAAERKTKQEEDALVDKKFEEVLPTIEAGLLDYATNGFKVYVYKFDRSNSEPWEIRVIDCLAYYLRDQGLDAQKDTHQTGWDCNGNLTVHTQHFLVVKLPEPTT